MLASNFPIKKFYEKGMEAVCYSASYVLCCFCPHFFELSSHALYDWGHYKFTKHKKLYHRSGATNACHAVSLNATLASNSKVKA